MRAAVIVALVLMAFFACNVDAKQHHGVATVDITPSKMDPNVTIPCLACETVVSGIAVSVYAGNSTLAILEAVAQYLCNTFGGSTIGAECQAIIGDIQQIVNWIESKVPTVQICENLGFCTNYVQYIAKYAQMELAAPKEHHHRHHNKHH
jgi:hypothetical protein